MVTQAGEVFVVDRADRLASAMYAAALAVAVAAAAVFSEVLGPWPPGWPLLAGVVLAGCSVPVPLSRQAKGAAVVVVACWLVPSVWLAWVCWRGLSSGVWVAWGCGALVLAVLSLRFATPTDFGGPARQQVPPTSNTEPEPEELARQWVALVARVAKVKGVHDVVVTHWDNGNGYTVAGLLPDDGATWEDLQPYQARFASALRLPRGASVTVGPGTDHGGFSLAVTTKDAMVEMEDYPL